MKLYGTPPTRAVRALWLINELQVDCETAEVSSGVSEHQSEAIRAINPACTVPEAKAALLPMLPDALFPASDKAGWWLEAVQLDLEAKGIIKRAPSKPVQLFRVAAGT